MKGGKKDSRFMEDTGRCKEDRRQSHAGNDGGSRTGTIDGHTTTDKPERAEESEKEPS